MFTETNQQKNTKVGVSRLFLELRDWRTRNRVSGAIAVLDTKKLVKFAGLYNSISLYNVNLLIHSYMKIFILLTVVSF